MHRAKQMFRSACLMIATLFLSTSLYAVNGVSVNVLSSTSGSWDLGGYYGDVWRHDVVKSVATTHKKIFKGAASFPVISPDGQWVAFIRRVGTTDSGNVCLLPITADTTTTPTVLAGCGSLSVIDFPDNNWIYFMAGTTKSGGNPSAKIFKRVNRSGTIEVVSTLNWECVQLAVSNDLTRAAMRISDYTSTSAIAGVVAYDMKTGAGTTARKLTTQPMSCGAGISGDGKYVQISWIEHHGYNIHTWIDGARVAGFSDSAFISWPPNRAVGSTKWTSHPAFDGCMATNSSKWMVLLIASKQMLVNWQDSQCVAATNGASAGSMVWSAGDLWVGDTTDPVLKLSADTVHLECPAGGPAPAAASIAVTRRNTTGTLADVTASISYTNGSNWLKCTPSGSGNAQAIDNEVIPTGLAGGFYRAVVTVTSSNADPISITYVVKLKVVAPRVFTSITVTPQSDTAIAGEIVQFSATAFDQYPESYASPTFTWSISGGQSISSTGLFIAGQAEGGPYTVTVSATIAGVTKTASTTVQVKKEGYLTSMLSLRNDDIAGYPTTLRLTNGNFDQLRANSALLGVHDSLVKPAAGDAAHVGGFRYAWKKVEQADGKWDTDPYCNSSVSYHGINVMSPAAMDVKFVYISHEGLDMYLNGKKTFVGYSEPNEVILPVSLRQGDNYLLIRHTSYASGSWIKCKFTDASGNAIPALVYRYENSPISVLPLAKNSYETGETMNIVWTADSSDIVGSLLASISTDNGLTWCAISDAIVYGTSPVYSGNVGSLSWVIPDSVATTASENISTVSRDCLIKVWAPYGTQNPQPSSVSQKITIAASQASGAKNGVQYAFVNKLSLTRAQGGLVLLIAMNGPFTAELTDLAGRTVWSAQGRDAQKFMIDSRSAAPGMKIIKVKNNGTTIFKKMMVY